MNDTTVDAVHTSPFAAQTGCRPTGLRQRTHRLRAIANRETSTMKVISRPGLPGAEQDAAPPVHSLHGNHMSGLATPGRGARQIEMWRGRMEAGAATPPHRHDTEEVVLILSGSGRATVGDRALQYAPGDTLILPPDLVHQIFADTATELVSAMPSGGTVQLPDGTVMELPWRA
jgi:quercetin dioxygenase-like cupin family protein